MQSVDSATLRRDTDPEEGAALVRVLDEALAAAWLRAFAGKVDGSLSAGYWSISGAELRDALQLEPSDPRSSSLWKESLRAASAALVDGQDSAAERADAIRMLTALCEDPLGGRFAPAWLLRIALEPDLSHAQRGAFASAARRLSKAGSATAKWGRVSEVSAAVAAGDRELAIDLATVAASVDGPDDGLDALVLAVRCLSGTLTQPVLRRAVNASPRIVVFALALPGSRRIQAELLSALEASRAEWLARCRSAILTLDSLDEFSGELRLRFGSAAPCGTGPRETLELADLSAQDLSVWCARLESFAESARASLAAWLDAEQERVEQNRGRLARFLTSLSQDLQGWERQVAAIEREAAEAGIALHDFGLYSPFHWKRRKRAIAFRAHHEECVTNRDQAKSLLESNERRIAVELVALDARMASVEEFRGRLPTRTGVAEDPSAVETPVL